MNIKFFTMELNNATELKNAYRDLIKKNHPDVGGCTESMKTINAEYEYLFNNVNELGRSRMSAEDLKKDFNSLNDSYREQLEKIIFLNDINIEVIGSWLWLSGSTYQHYDTIKGEGFKWSKSKKAWYWYKGIDTAKTFYKSHCKNLQEVRNMHGSTKVNSVENKQLACA